MNKIRSPICVVIGHVDHGKSSILDKIRGTAIVKTEAGGITQAIGASIIPIDTIKRICGPLLERMAIKFTIPGLLFIDTPGHAAFRNLRKRGGNLADIAILVVDINEGFMPQTFESIDILKQYKTPFIVAANKVDLVKGWRSDSSILLLENIQKQNVSVINEVETKLYKIVSTLSELGFSAERFDRVEDYKKQIAIVPCSAKTGEGIPEMIAVLSGLAQKYLSEELKLRREFASGMILEVKEEKGLGKTMDVILYDGILKVNDILVIGGLENPIVVKVRALFEPMPLTEMREKKAKFKPVKEVIAATGVKVAAAGIDEVIAGMPLRSSSKSDLEKTKEDIQKEVEEVLISIEKCGIIVKADTLGSLEALTNLLKEKGISVKRATIGNITKKDVSEAETCYESNPFDAVVLGFNVVAEAEGTARAKVITNNVIYKLVEDFEKWVEEEKKRIESSKLGALVRPCKIQLLSGYVFRQSNPAIVGSEILAGTAVSGTPLMNKDGKLITSIKEIQSEGEPITTAEKGKRVAIAMEKVIVGRQIKEGDVLYSAIPEEHFRKYKELKEYLTQDEMDVLKEIVEIMRKKYPVWGI